MVASAKSSPARVPRLGATSPPRASRAHSPQPPCRACTIQTGLTTPPMPRRGRAHTREHEGRARRYRTGALFRSVQLQLSLRARARAPPARYLPVQNSNCHVSRDIRRVRGAEEAGRRRERQMKGTDRQTCAPPNRVFRGARAPRPSPRAARRGGATAVPGHVQHAGRGAPGRTAPPGGGRGRGAPECLNNLRFAGPSGVCRSVPTAVPAPHPRRHGLPDDARSIARVGSGASGPGGAGTWGAGRASHVSPRALVVKCNLLNDTPLLHYCATSARDTFLQYLGTPGLRDGAGDAARARASARPRRKCPWSSVLSSRIGRHQPGTTV